MRKVFLFMMVTLDGYFEGENHDLSWHNVDREFNDNFIIPQTKKVKTILFGRRTYEMMARFWPSPEAKKSDPVTSELMENAEKFVFSKTLKSAEWKNTKLVNNHTFELVKKLKELDGEDIAIFGSNNLCVNLMEKGLIDEFRIIINPIVLEKGTRLFEGFNAGLNLKLLNSRQFKNGNILLCYSPI